MPGRELMYEAREPTGKPAIRVNANFRLPSSAILFRLCSGYAAVDN